MEIIHFLGEKLAQSINISPTAARGLIKLAIKDEFGPFQLFTQINYIKLRCVIQNSLKKRLDDLKIQKNNFIIKNLLTVLQENQSLFTMGNF